MAFNELALDQKQALAAHPDAKIAKRAKALLAKGGGIPNADRQKVVEEFLPLIKKAGNVELGKAVFKKNCLLCHTHSGEGAKIGPDLSGVAAHTKEHLLIDILDPSRSVEGNFKVYQVTTQAGLVLNGLLASETKTTIELFDTQGKKIVIPRDEIEQIVRSPKSLMPDGFEKQLKADELIDLLEFLTARGKFVPLALDKAATIVSTRGMFYDKDSTFAEAARPADLDAENWSRGSVPVRRSADRSKAERRPVVRQKWPHPGADVDAEEGEAGVQPAGAGRPPVERCPRRLGRPWAKKTEA